MDFLWDILFPEQFIITVSPNPVTDIPVGSNVTLTCNVFIVPEVAEDKVTVQWTKFVLKGGQAPLSPTSLCGPVDCGYSITLTDIDASSEGLYICTVTVGEREESGNTYLTPAGESHRKFASLSLEHLLLDV